MGGKQYHLEAVVSLGSVLLVQVNAKCQKTTKLFPQKQWLLSFIKWLIGHCDLKPYNFDVLI